MKSEKIKSLVIEMLNESHAAMIKKVEKVLNSGAVDIESWDEKDKPMILPKCIVMALLESEGAQYDARGTSFERHIKKEVRNIRFFV